MNYLTDYQIACPYCGEQFETSLDTSQGDQTYFEDCYVCCRPIKFDVRIDHAGELAEVRLSRDDE